MKKNIIVIAISLFLIIGIAKAQDIYNYYGSQENQAEENLGGEGGANLDKYSITSTSLESTSSTTEKVFYSYDAKMVDYNIAFTPTGATSVLTWKNYYSYDNVTYYPEDIYILASTTGITHGPSEAIHRWTPGGTSLVYKNVSNRDLQAPWTKVIFGCETATGTIAVDIILRNETK